MGEQRLSSQIRESFCGADLQLIDSKAKSGIMWDPLCSCSLPPIETLSTTRRGTNVDWITFACPLQPEAVIYTIQYKKHRWLSQKTTEFGSHMNKDQ